MPPDNTPDSWSESDVTSMNFKDTELTLGLPGEAGSPAAKSCMKRGFLDTVDFSLGISTACNGTDTSEKCVSGGTKPPYTKEQVVGWPPVRSFRKKAIHDHESSKYIKVAVDGAPYLRKVDLVMYSSYEELLRALDKMFSCFTICKRKLVDPVKGTEYVPTYEDKDGDWMLVGDVPWTMFIESCKRIRLKKSSEAASLDPRTTPKCKSTRGGPNSWLGEFMNDKTMYSYQSQYFSKVGNKG